MSARSALTILFCLFFNSAFLFGQIESDGVTRFASDSTEAKTDTTRRSDPAWQYSQELALGNDSFNKWDSTFRMIHRYNRLTRSGLPFADLGTTASPHKLLLISHPQAGFQSGFNPYSAYNKTPDSFRFYKAAVPLTRFFYTQGGNGVFILDALHTQNFSPTWNFTVDLSSNQNGEIYTNSKQDHFHKALALGSNFSSKNGKYYHSVILTWNRAKRLENRGLLNDSFFYIPTSEKLRIGGNYVPATGTVSTFYAQHHHKIEQQYRLKSNNLYLFHKFDWIKEKYQYTEISTFFSDNDSAFYTGNPYKSGNFIDSTVWIQYNNSFGAGGAHVFKLPIQWRGWYAYDRMAYNSIWKFAANTYANQSVHAVVQTTDLIKGIKINAATDQYISGWNAGDHLETVAAFFNLQKFRLHAGLKNQAYKPGFMSQRFAGNYYQIYTNRQATTVREFNYGAVLSQRHIVLGINGLLGTTGNYLYVDTNAMYQQADRINYNEIAAFIRFRAGKFYAENRFMIKQQSRADILPFPKYTGIASIYYQGPMFKKAMNARFGADIWYTSQYNGYSYNPMIAAFYPTQKKTGNYPVIDFYFSGEVKTMVFYLKLEHSNNALMNYGFSSEYSSAISYPIEPFRFRFGFSWRFYN